MAAGCLLRGLPSAAVSGGRISGATECQGDLLANRTNEAANRNEMEVEHH